MEINNTDPNIVRKTYEWLDQHTKYGSSFHGRSLLPIVKSLKNVNSVLDVGTGRGEFCNWAIENLCQDVTGSDFAINPNPSFLNKNINFIKNLSHEIPLPDNSVDLLVSFDVLEHIRPEDIPETIKEFSRVTKKYMLHKVSSTAASDGPTENPYLPSIKNLHLIQQGRGAWEHMFHTNLDADDWRIYRIDRAIFVIKKDAEDKAMREDELGKKINDEERARKRAERKARAMERKEEKQKRLDE